MVADLCAHRLEGFAGELQAAGYQGDTVAFGLNVQKEQRRLRWQHGRETSSGRVTVTLQAWCAEMLSSEQYVLEESLRASLVQLSASAFWAKVAPEALRSMCEAVPARRRWMDLFIRLAIGCSALSTQTMVCAHQYRPSGIYGFYTYMGL